VKRLPPAAKPSLQAEKRTAVVKPPLQAEK